MKIMQIKIMNIPSIHIICWIAGYIDPSPCWSEGNICSRRFTRVMRWPPLPYSYSAAWFAAPFLWHPFLLVIEFDTACLTPTRPSMHIMWTTLERDRIQCNCTFVKCLTKVCSETEYPDFCVRTAREILQHGKDSFQRKLFECSPSEEQ